jgi:glycosyltransferase involved in cell wall biosynthesis
MKIAFLLGSPDISGGTYVIFEHATRLNRLGHGVTIVTENPVDANRYSWHPSAGELTWNTIPDLEESSFDLAIATWWKSVYLLHRIKSRKYLYFIQSIESRFFPARDCRVLSRRDIDILCQWCENTYRINLPIITEAKWIQQYLRVHHNRSAYLVRNGIRKDIYTENGPAVATRRDGFLRVLVEGPLGVFFKNVEKTIGLCRQAGVDELWLLTSSEVDGYPGVDRCFSRVPIQRTAEIYRSCDVLVKLSYVEGMFGPPLEMFHCGGTAIVYDVTGHDEYIRHGENSLVVKCDDELQVVDWLRKLKSDPKLLQLLQVGARQTALDWPDWDVATNEFHRAIGTCDQSYPDVSSAFLAENTAFMMEIRENALGERGLSRLFERERVGGYSSTSFLNHVQVYWDSGRGIEAELTDSYQSGSWSKCRIVVPSTLPPKILRIDPSVRMGIVEIRLLRISGVASGTVFRQWREGDSWHDIAVAGTACVLKMDPYPLLEAYGEDPQLFLPNLPISPDGEQLLIEMEVRESGFAQALVGLIGIGERNTPRRGVGRLRRFCESFMRRLLF